MMPPAGQAVAKAMKNRLARELRDIIYAYLFPPDDNPILLRRGRVEERKTGGQSLGSPNISPKGLYMYIDPHFKESLTSMRLLDFIPSPQEMDVQVASEMVEMYYSRNTFQISIDLWNNGVHHLFQLGMDTWNGGVLHPTYICAPGVDVPNPSISPCNFSPFAFMRKVQIRIRLDQDSMHAMSRDSISNRVWPRWKTSHPGRCQYDDPQLALLLHNLYFGNELYKMPYFPCHNRIKLAITVETSLMFLISKVKSNSSVERVRMELKRLFINLMEILWWPIYTLKRRARSTSVTHSFMDDRPCSHAGAWYEPSIGPENEHHFDLGHCFEGTAEAWHKVNYFKNMGISTDDGYKERHQVQWWDCTKPLPSWYIWSDGLTDADLQAYIDFVCATRWGCKDCPGGDFIALCPQGPLI